MRHPEDFACQRLHSTAMTYKIVLELGEPHTVRVAVAGGVAENGGVFVQLKVIAVVLHLHHRVVHLRTGNIQPRHGVGILRSGFRQLCLSTEGITSPAGVADV